MDTFEELCVKLMVKSDIEDIIDLLQLTPEDLVRRFEDRFVKATPLNTSADTKLKVAQRI